MGADWNATSSKHIAGALSNFSDHLVPVDDLNTTSSLASSCSSTIVFAHTASNMDEIRNMTSDVCRQIKNQGTHPNVHCAGYHGSVYIIVTSHHNLSDIDALVRNGNITVTNSNNEILTGFLIEDEGRLSEKEITTLDAIGISIGVATCIVIVVIFVILRRRRMLQSSILSDNMG
jgi:hypothetical protein